MANSEKMFKLPYETRRQIIYLLDQINEFLLIEKLNGNHTNEKSKIDNKTNVLIGKMNELELIENNPSKKRKLNQQDEIYLDLNNELQEKIINNLKLIINKNEDIKNIIENNRKLIDDLQKLNDFNFNSIFIKNENNQINRSFNLNNQSHNLINQNQSANLDNQNRSVNLDLDNRNQSVNLNYQFASSNLINQPANLNNQNQQANLINQSAYLNKNQPAKFNQSASLTYQNQSLNSNNLNQSLNNEPADLEMNKNIKLELYNPLDESYSTFDDDIIEITVISKSSDQLNKNTGSNSLPTEINDQTFESDKVSKINNINQTTVLNNQDTMLNDNHRETGLNNENETTELNNDQIFESNETTELNNDQISELNETTESNNQSNQLTIINPQDLNDVDVHWLKSNNLINFANTKIFWNDSFYKDLFREYSNLKYLKISSLIDDFKLIDINKFHQLEQLDIYFLAKLDDDICLKLKQLKIFQIEHDYRIKNKIKIESSKLNYFYCTCLKIMNIINKESIEIIDTELLDESIYEFPNIKIINFYLNIDNYVSNQTSINIDSIINKIEISKLINLKRINFVVSNLSPDIKINYNGIFDSIKKWLNEKTNNNLKFYLTNLEIDNLEYLEYLRSISEKLFSRKEDVRMRIFFENLNKLESELNFLCDINYNVLTNYLNDQKFANLFFQKFNNIRSIKTNKEIKNSEEFLKFLEKLDKLCLIELNGPHLENEFYLEFSKLKHLITNFSLIETKTETELNYDFLSNFKLLMNLTLIGNLNLNLKSIVFFIKLMHKLDILVNIKFNFKRITIKLLRDEMDLIEVKLESKDSSNLKSIDFFINLMYELDILVNIKFNFKRIIIKLLRHEMDLFEVKLESEDSSNLKPIDENLNKLINKEIDFSGLKKIASLLKDKKRSDFLKSD